MQNWEILLEFPLLLAVRKTWKPEGRAGSILEQLRPPTVYCRTVWVL